MGKKWKEARNRKSVRMLVCCDGCNPSKCTASKLSCSYLVVLRFLRGLQSQFFFEKPPAALMLRLHLPMLWYNYLFQLHSCPPTLPFDHLNARVDFVYGLQIGLWMHLKEVNWFCFSLRTQYWFFQDLFSQPLKLLQSLGAWDILNVLVGLWS